MKSTLIAVVSLLGVFPSASTAQTTFSDNFDDGDAAGWWLGYSHHTPWLDGNWRVETGTLAQDQGGDDYIALVEGLTASSQVIETDLWLHAVNGYGGVTLWYQDPSHWTAVRLYPAAAGVWVSETDGSVSKVSQFAYRSTEATWHHLTVEADSATGNSASL